MVKEPIRPREWHTYSVRGYLKYAANKVLPGITSVEIKLY
jgi:hypothetical protein